MFSLLAAYLLYHNKLDQEPTVAIIFIEMLLFVLFSFVYVMAH